MKITITIKDDPETNGTEIIIAGTPFAHNTKNHIAQRLTDAARAVLIGAKVRQKNTMPIEPVKRSKT